MPTFKYESLVYDLNNKDYNEELLKFIEQNKNTNDFLFFIPSNCKIKDDTLFIDYIKAVYNTGIQMFNSSCSHAVNYNPQSGMKVMRNAASVKDTVILFFDTFYPGLICVSTVCLVKTDYKHKTLSGMYHDLLRRYMVMPHGWYADVAQAASKLSFVDDTKPEWIYKPERSYGEIEAQTYLQKIEKNYSNKKKLV